MFFFCFIFLIIKTIISNPICESYVNHCLKCNPKNNLCSKCEQSEILIPDQNGGCKGIQKCILGKNYCYECELDGKICKTCEEGYYPDENGGCSTTNFCKISYKGLCIECKENFILTGQKFELKFCKSIKSDDFLNCEEIGIERGLCIKCKEGFFLNKGDKKCTKIENCKDSIYGNCVSCNNGYYLDKKENKCKEQKNNLLYCKQSLDNENCDICQDETYFAENGNCTFSNYCSKSINGKCEKCIDGYYLTNNSYCSDTDNCNYADSDNGICFSCFDNYYLDTKDFKCKSNIENIEFQFCKKVENNICVNCELSYSLDEESKCCNTHKCAKSKNGICIQCSENYYLGLDNYCSNIEHCIYSKFTQCVECEDNFYYNILYEQCLEAIDIFYGCKISNDDGYLCSECKNNYYLRRNDSLCFDNNDEIYYKCAFTDYKGENCTKCIDGYYLGYEDKKCSLIENCAVSEREDKCIKCNNGYCFDVKKGICINNEKIVNINEKFYFACNKTNKEGNLCEQCIEGFKLNEEGFCTNFENCEKNESNICIKCKESSEEKDYCLNEVFGCIKTDLKNCLKCDNIFDFNKCTKCLEGYTISVNGQCLK